MTEHGFALRPGDHPIAPIMIGDAARAVSMADKLLDEGAYVVEISYPVVPNGAARIRVQISAALNEQDLEFTMTAFAKVQQQLP